MVCRDFLKLYLANKPKILYMHNVHIQIYPILDRLSLLCEYLVRFWDSVLETIEQNVKLIETLETSACILFRTF